MPNWVEELGVSDPELAQNPNLTKYASLQDALKGHVELAKTLGNRVAVPGPNATPEERAAFYTKIGRPEAPDKYDLAGLQGPVADIFRETAFETGLPSSGVKTVAEKIKGFFDQVKAQHDAEQAKYNESFEKEKETLTKEWGDQYTSNMQEIKNLIVKAGGDGEQGAALLKKYEESGVFDSKASAAALLEIAKATRTAPFFLPKGRTGETAAATKAEELSNNKEFMDKVAAGDRNARQQYREALEAAEKESGNPQNLIQSFTA